MPVPIIVKRKSDNEEEDSDHGIPRVLNERVDQEPCDNEQEQKRKSVTMTPIATI